jgi:hypothetical protein
MQVLDSIEAKTVKVARRRGRTSGEISTWLWFEWIKFADRIWLDRVLDRDVEPICLRRPNAEMRFARPDQFGADRQATLAREIHYAFTSPDAEAAAVCCRGALGIIALPAASLIGKIAPASFMA